MKIVKSLLLGSAAALIAGGAQAADLPNRGKAAPVEYVKVCSTYGAGFFYVPGTNGCLRVAGQVRAEYYFNEGTTKASNVTSTRARGRLFIDHRNQTEYGTLRTYIFYQLTKNSSTNLDVNAVSGTVLYHAFVQFGGLTAGRVQSFHDFYGNAMAWGLIRTSERPINALAYTATFGNGLTATLSLEDGVMRQSTGAGFTYGGHVMPDIVLALGANQGWGTAQLSGAVHQIRSTTIGVDAKYGFAVRGGVMVKLDQLAKGDKFYLEAAYADGALDYLYSSGDNNVGSLTNSNATVASVTDARLVGTSIKTSKGFQVMGAFAHYWTPEWRSVLHASYVDVNQAIGGTDFKETRLAKQLVWSPVSGLDIGAEVLWARLSPKAGRSDDNWSGRLRVQRTF